MIHIRTVSSLFHARVIQARLGADGIPAQLSGNVGGPYPFGTVSIWVDVADADEAGDLLLADEVESAFDLDPASDLDGASDDDWPWDGLPDAPTGAAPALPRWTPRRVLAAFGLLLMVVAAFSSRVVW
jgi:hypothetical protein